MLRPSASSTCGKLQLRVRCRMALVAPRLRATAATRRKSRSLELGLEIWWFPKNRGSLFAGPYNKAPIKSYYLGS